MGIYHIGGDEIAMIIGPAKADLVGDQAFVSKIVAPTLSGISPATAVVGAPVPITATGTGFMQLSRITVSGIDQATTFVSDTELTATVAAAAAASTVPIEVRTGEMVSEPVDFTFTDVGTRRR